MSRLTKKLDNGEYEMASLFSMHTIQALNKMGKLEDIEEEVGCPVDILWKIRNQEFVYVDGLGKCKVVAIHIEPRTVTNIEYYNPITKDNRLLFVSDYKENFWLDGNKSE